MDLNMTRTVLNQLPFDAHMDTETIINELLFNLKLSSVISILSDVERAIEELSIEDLEGIKSKVEFLGPRNEAMLIVCYF